MYPRRTLVTLLILTLAAAALLHQLQRVRGNPDPLATRLVFPKPLDAVESLAIERGDETLSLRRQNGAWEITRPINVPADAQRVRRFLDALEALPVNDQFSTRSLEQRQLTLHDFGLDPPQARITTGLWTLDVGHASPTGHALYLRHSGLPSKIIATHAAFLQELPAAFLEFRQRLLIHAKPSHITALEIRRPGQPTFRVIRKDNLWHLVQPIAGRASQTAVNELAQALAELSIEHFIWPPTLSDPATTPEPPPLADFGLDPESALSLLIWEQAQTSPLRLRFSQPVPENPGLLHALAADQATLVAVPAAILNLLDLPPSEFRDKRLFREDPEQLANITIRYPGQTLELECDDGHWTLTSPVRNRANQRMVRSLANTLLNLRADRIVVDDLTDPTDQTDQTDPLLPSAFSLQPSSRQLQLAFKNLPPVVLHFQHTPLETQFAFANDPAITYCIASTNLPPELINLDEATHLADPQILDLLPEAVTRVTFTSTTSTQVWERANGHWKKDPSDPSDPTDPTDLLEALCSLRAERVAQLTPLLPVQLETLGLTPPALEITLDLSDDSPSFRRVLSIGAPASPGLLHATLRGADILYVVSTNAIPASLMSE